MRLIDADSLLERIWRLRVDSREAIAEIVETEPTMEASSVLQEKGRMTWDEFNEANLQVMYDGQVKTYIDCPVCGKKVLWDSRIVLASFPPKYQYWCPCGWSGDSYRRWVRE